MSCDNTKPDITVMTAEIYGHPFDSEDTHFPVLSIDNNFDKQTGNVLITVFDTDGQSCSGTFNPIVVRNALEKFIDYSF